MADSSHREQVIGLLVKLNERQITIFKHLKRIDGRLDQLNGKVAEHESNLIQIKTWINCTSNNRKPNYEDRMNALIEKMKDEAVKHAMTLAQNQADTMQNGVVEWLKSDEFEILLAEKMDRAVDIPWTSDQKEEKMFRALADLIQNIVAGFVASIKIK